MYFAVVSGQWSMVRGQISLLPFYFDHLCSSQIFLLLPFTFYLLTFYLASMLLYPAANIPKHLFPAEIDRKSMEHFRILDNAFIREC